MTAATPKPPGLYGVGGPWYTTGVARRPRAAFSLFVRELS